MMVKNAAQADSGLSRDVPGSAREGMPERREQILLAAWDALSQVGFEKITTRRIAEAAGINIATLHYHFGSKEAVLTETLRYAQRWTDQQMRSAVAGSATSGEALERAFTQAWKLMTKRPGALRFDLVVRGFRDPDARSEALGVYGAYSRFIEEIIEWHIAEGGTLASDLTPPTLANYVVTVIDGVVLHHTLSGDDETAQRNLAIIKSQVFQLMEMSRDATAGRTD